MRYFMDCPEIIDLSKIFKNNDIPWNALSEKKQQIVKAYLYEQKTLEDIAFDLYTTKSKVRYDYYAALTKLSEFAVVRKFIDAKGTQLDPKTLDILQDVYIHLVERKVKAQQLGQTVNAVDKRIQRVLIEHDVKWTVFVKKQKGKVVFTVPRILK